VPKCASHSGDQALVNRAQEVSAFGFGPSRTFHLVHYNSLFTQHRTPYQTHILTVPTLVPIFRRSKTPAIPTFPPPFARLLSRDLNIPLWVIPSRIHGTASADGPYSHSTTFANARGLGQECLGRGLTALTTNGGGQSLQRHKAAKRYRFTESYNNRRFL
jgi:hypothetical protein